MSTNAYRSRIYGQYNLARQKVLAPENIDGFKSRATGLRLIVRRHFPSDRDARILDIGCGHGALIYFAREGGYRNVRGVDGSLEQIAAAQNLGIEGIEQKDIFDALKLQDNDSLDMAIVFDVIEHFTRDELIPLVDELRRVLKPGGRLLVHVPNGEALFSGRMRYWDITHEMAFTRTSLGQLFLASGFSSVDCFEDEPAVHGLKSAARWMLWKIFRLLLRLYIAAETGDGSREHIFSQNLLAVIIK